MNRKALLLWGMLAALPIGARAQRAHRLRFASPQALAAWLRPDSGRTLISAHRGGPAPGFPENAIATFANTLKLTPALVECDLQLTADSVVAILHDDTLGRTTTGRGRVAAHTWAALRRLRLKDNGGRVTHHHMPRLEEVLRWARGRAVLTLDVKRGTPMGPVLRAMDAANAYSYALVITYTLDAAQAWQAARPQLLLSVNVGNLETWRQLRARQIDLRRMVAFVGTRVPEQALYDSLHAHGVPAMLGTLGNLDKKASAEGSHLYIEWSGPGRADVLATDAPAAVREALERARRRRR